MKSRIRGRTLVALAALLLAAPLASAAQAAETDAPTSKARCHPARRT